MRDIGDGRYRQVDTARDRGGRAAGSSRRWRWGYLPGSEDVTVRRRPSGDRLALIADIVLLTAAVAIIGFAIVTRLRDRRAGGQPGAVPASPGGPAGRPTWRFSLIALGLLIGWLVLVLLADARRRVRPGDQPASGCP